ncbi:hypothetical protein CPB86DRAFT_827951 [Serendipita vermifera]|nr:hypothetical protein CPB86DRAFT_827951 [Serendipita vermifera]
MILGILGAVTGAVGAPLSMVAVPTSAAAVATSTVSVTQAVAGQQGSKQDSGSAAGTSNDSADLKNDPRLAKFTIRVRCDGESSLAEEVDGMQVVLRNGKLYLDDPDPDKRQFSDGHAFSGFYLEYAPIKPPPMGLVSTIQPDPPELNWIYVDTNTLEMKYGNKTPSIQHIVGPWDWTQDQSAVTIEGWEGFVAVEESPGVWILCYDRDDDLLESTRGSRLAIECSLVRMLL